jgi:hypothetical protein
MLQARPAPTADGAADVLAKHIGRRIGTPSDYEGHKRDSYAMAAATAKPSPVGLA